MRNRVIRHVGQCAKAQGQTYNRFIHARHHDLPLEFEERFIMAGIDPDTVGRFLPKELHKQLHGKGQTGWGRGGPLNFQWRTFFITPAEDGGFDPSRAKESILEFNDIIRSLTADNKLPPPDAWRFQP